MLRPIRKTPPSVRILSLIEAKAHLRVDHGDDDTLIEALILAAESYLDGWSGVLGRCLISQEWAISRECWPESCFELMFPDVSSIVVTYRDEADVEQTLEATNFYLLEGASCSLLQWKDSFTAPSLFDRGDAVTATVIAGYGETPDKIPAAIIHAAKLMIGSWYEQRENHVAMASVSSLPAPVAAEALIAPYRRIGL